MTVIKVRRGINGFKYSACDENGYFIGNFNRLSEIRNHWRREIGWGKVVLVRELNPGTAPAALAEFMPFRKVWKICGRF